MVEVYVFGPYNNYYAELTGRWYIAPSGLLCLEIEWTKGYWPIRTLYTDFISENEIRELFGELCA